MANILVLDDDPAILDFLGTLLRRSGHRVVEESTITGAIQAAKALIPDLIISDVVLPQMDGYEFLRRLRRDEELRNTRVIFFTGVYDPHEGAKALAESCGVIRFLVKPAEPGFILEAVETTLAEANPGAPDTAAGEFERQHRLLLMNKLFEKVRELETTNRGLRESDQQFRSFFEANPLPMWVFDSETLAFLAVNNAAVSHYGYSREEFLSMTIRDIRPPEELPALDARLSAVTNQVLARTGPLRHRTKSGTVLDALTFSHMTTFMGRPARVVLIEDVTRHNRAQRKLRESEERMRYLAAHIQSAREEERTRIARQMHDELGQLLTAIKINCSRIQMNVPETGACPKLRTVVDLVDQTIVTVRRLATELRPGILDLGLQAAIEWQAQEFEERSEIACHVEYRGADNDLDPKCATELFRIFQEILTNVARHSGATEVQVTLIRDSEQLVMEVRDNGRGVSPEEVNSRTALGILGMKERAALIGGAVIIAGQPGTGTRVQVRIPLRSALSARQAS